MITTINRIFVIKRLIKLLDRLIRRTTAQACSNTPVVILLYYEHNVFRWFCNRTVVREPCVLERLELRSKI